MAQPRKRSAAVREPLQVYLTRDERNLLDRVASHAGLSRAEVLRRALKRFGAETLGEPHPGLEFLDAMSGGWPAATPNDVAERHDEYLSKEYVSRRKKPRR
jgi:hypothetical protein